MVDSAQPRSLSVAEIAEAMEACRANARELLEEADILLEACRKARSYTLVHTAFEELAKFFILALAGKRVAQGNSPNWKRFWQRLRNHDSKIAQAEVQLFNIMTENGPHGDQNMAQQNVLLAYGLVPRNASLYVELAPNGRFRKPSDVDWSVGIAAMKDTTARLLRAADEVGSSYGGIESHLRGPNSDRDKERVIKTLQHAIEGLREAGMTEESASGQLEKLWKMSGKA
jgi:AbiV family abortive infection protein